MMSLVDIEKRLEPIKKERPLHVHRMLEHPTAILGPEWYETIEELAEMHPFSRKAWEVPE